MTNFFEKVIFSLMIYTVAFIRFILAELLFESKVSVMLEKTLSRSSDSAFFSINDTCSYKINSPDMNTSM